MSICSTCKSWQTSLPKVSQSESGSEISLLIAMREPLEQMYSFRCCLLAEVFLSLRLWNVVPFPYPTDIWNWIPLPYTWRFLVGVVFMFRMFGYWKRVIRWDLGAESKCYSERNALIRRNLCSLQIQLCAVVILQEDSMFFGDNHLLKSACLLCGSMHDYCRMWHHACR